MKFIITMSVDKFGRRGDILQHRKVRGPPGEGFSLTAKGHYDMKNKLVRNMGEPKAGKDAVTLHYLEKNCLIIPKNKTIECDQNILRNIGKAELENDAVSLHYLKSESLVRNPDGHYDVKRKLIRNLEPPVEDGDAATKGYVNEVIRILQKDIENKLVKLETVVFKHVHNKHETIDKNNING